MPALQFHQRSDIVSDDAQAQAMYIQFNCTSHVTTNSTVALCLVQANSYGIGPQAYHKWVHGSDEFCNFYSCLSLRMFRFRFLVRRQTSLYLSWFYSVPSEFSGIVHLNRLWPTHFAPFPIRDSQTSSNSVLCNLCTKPAYPNLLQSTLPVGLRLRGYSYPFRMTSLFISQTTRKIKKVKLSL
jgi:hypothetical protein